MTQDRTDTERREREPTDEELLRGKWTGKGIDDHPLSDELKRMVNLLEKFPRVRHKTH